MQKKQSVWERDIAYDVVGVLAVFGLVVSSLVAGLGVATLGVQVQLAFAEQTANSTQSAASFMATEARMAPRPMEGSSTPPSFNASSTPPRDVKAALTLKGAMYCPKLSAVVSRGGKDATTTGSISELQRFIASHYGLEASSTVTGYFGSTTAAYLTKFQEEQGIPPAPVAGALTRAAIAKLCMGGDEHRAERPLERFDDRSMSSSSPTTGNVKPPHMGSTTSPHKEMMDTTTRPVEPPRPVSMEGYEGASNAAAVLSAINEIGMGVGHLVLASLSLLGL